jgi:internalin A
MRYTHELFSPWLLKCKGNQAPHFYPKGILDQFLADRQLKIQCQKSYQMVDVRRLIDNLVFPAFDDLAIGERIPQASNQRITRLEGQAESWPTQTESSEAPALHNGDHPIEKQIFISFKWHTDSEKIADQIDEAFQAKGITIRRDCKDIQYKDSIQDFMQALGRGKCVIAVIDDAYLKSENCMFELVEILANGDFRDRIFPIVLPDAQIYKPAKRIKYVQHWEREIEELEEAMKSVSAANMQGFRDEIDLYTRIRATIAELTNTLNNMNTLKVEDHIESGFAQLFTAIKQKLTE